jgi:hypothetical protein
MNIVDLGRQQRAIVDTDCNVNNLWTKLNYGGDYYQIDQSFSNFPDASGLISFIPDSTILPLPAEGPFRFMAGRTSHLNAVRNGNYCTMKGNLSVECTGDFNTIVQANVLIPQIYGITSINDMYVNCIFSSVASNGFAFQVGNPNGWTLTNNVPGSSTTNLFIQFHQIQLGGTTPGVNEEYSMPFEISWLENPQAYVPPLEIVPEVLPSIEEEVEENVEEVVEEKVEEVVEENVEEVVEESAEEIVEENVEEVIEESTEEVIEESTEEVETKPEVTDPVDIPIVNPKPKRSRKIPTNPRKSRYSKKDHVTKL